MIVIADTSILLNLCCIRQEHLLRQLFGSISNPRTVMEEFNSLSSRQQRFTGLQIPAWVEVLDPTKTLHHWSPTARLDPGENAAIALAKDFCADLILMDERRGRVVANDLGLQVMGILGILILAKQKGLLRCVTPIVNQLVNTAGFHLSERHRTQVLKIAQEPPP